MGSVRDVKSAKSLEALRPDSKGQVLRAAPGLTGTVRVGVAGRISVSFEYAYRFGGKARYLSCGTFPNVSLAMIRESREKARALIAQGLDPASEARISKLAKKLDQERQAAMLNDARADIRESMLRPTVSDVFNKWFSLEVSRHKDHGAYVRRLFECDVLPTIGSIYADSLTKLHLLDVLDIIKSRQAYRMANVALAYLKAFCRFAVDRGYLAADPSSTLTKGKHAGGKERHRDRWLSQSEVVSLATLLPASGLILRTQLAVWTMLSTLCRVGELCKARKQDIDLKRSTWRIPAESAKNGRERVIFLSRLSVDLLSDLIELSDDPDWLIPSRSGNGHIDPKALTKQLVDRQRASNSKARTHKATALQLPGGLWTAHDLRRSGATLMGELACRSDVIERCLGHLEQDRLVRTYQHQLLVDEQIQAFQILGDRLEVLRRGHAESKVVSLRRAG